MIQFVPYSAFLDSSVLFTAVNSHTGGSSKLFTVKTLQLVTSPTVLTEVERNVRKKLQDYHLERFFLLARQVKILDQTPNTKLIQKALKVIVEKDAVILAEAKQSQARYLVTLDTHHFFTPRARNFVKPTKIVSPKILFHFISE